MVAAPWWEKTKALSRAKDLVRPGLRGIVLAFTKPSGGWVLFIENIT